MIGCPKPALIVGLQLALLAALQLTSKPVTPQRTPIC
jgi:hypothetical protein